MGWMSLVLHGPGVLQGPVQDSTCIFARLMWIGVLAIQVVSLSTGEKARVGAALIAVSCLPQDRILSLSQSLSKDAHIVEDPEEALGHIVRRACSRIKWSHSQREKKLA